MVRRILFIVLLFSVGCARADIYRPIDGKGTEKEEVPIELQKIMDRKTPDVALRAGVVLYIPDNRRSRMTASILDKVISFGAGTASGVLVTR